MPFLHTMPKSQANSGPIPFGVARQLLFSQVRRFEAEPCSLAHTVGRVLRQDIMADRDVPAFDRVMMDGFAFRSEEIPRFGRFTIRGIAVAGKPAPGLSDAPGRCVEVNTGAPLPAGADTVVPVEEVIRDGDEVRLLAAESACAGRFIHRVGSDAVAGQVLLRAGRRIGAREIGIAASCGAGNLLVSRLPAIAVIATGDELVRVEEFPKPYQIRQSNAHALTAALRGAGYPVLINRSIGDDPDLAMSGLRQALELCDWIILTGAVSKGSRDFVPECLSRLGCSNVFHGVAQRPGKPAGCWNGPEGQTLMALPGNPVSALVGMHAFVLPALDVALGTPPAKPEWVLPAGEIQQIPGMTQHLPVSLDAARRALPSPVGNSGDFIGLLASDGWITVPPRGEAATAFPFTPWF